MKGSIVLAVVLMWVGFFAGYRMRRCTYTKNPRGPFWGLFLLSPFIGIWIIVPHDIFLEWFLTTVVLEAICLCIGDLVARGKNQEEDKQRKRQERAEAKAARKRMTTLERIAEIILEYLDVPEGITEDTPVQQLYESYGIETSADFFALELEMGFELEDDIPNEIAQAWRTIREVVDYIDDKVAAQTAQP